MRCAVVPRSALENNVWHLCQPAAQVCCAASMEQHLSSPETHTTHPIDRPPHHHPQSPGLQKQEPAAKKRKKGDKSKKQEPELDYDPTLHPWRPFDREKDLAAGRGGGSASAEDMLKSARALGSRFSGGQGSGGRTFL